MVIKELTIKEFEDYALSNPLRSYMQSVKYAQVMGNEHYNYDYIGLVDNGVIKAASLILLKKIGVNMRYGYAPKGFLINYYDQNLLRTFVTKLKEFYAKKNVIFIKINPEIVVAQVDNKTHEVKENANLKLKYEIQSFGFMKLKDNLYFESMEPRFNAYIDLKNTRFNGFSKANRNKVRNSNRKGLYMSLGNEADLDSLYPILRSDKSLNYYKNLYSAFSKDKSIDILLVRVDYEKYIKNSQNLYEIEQNNNSLLNEILHRSRRPQDLNKKMASDAKLIIIKNEIISATEGLKNNNEVLVAGAIVVKDGKRAHVITSGFDREYATLNANYFLYNALIDNYKMDFNYLDLGGVTGDYKKTNPYKGLNDFILGFNPCVYEYIGEYDLVFNRNDYDAVLKNGKLAQEFNKKGK